MSKQSAKYVGCANLPNGGVQQVRIDPESPGTYYLWPVAGFDEATLTIDLTRTGKDCAVCPELLLDLVENEVLGILYQRYGKKFDDAVYTTLRDELKGSFSGLRDLLTSLDKPTTSEE